MGFSYFRLSPCSSDFFRLTKLEVERLGSLFAWSHLELDLIPFAKLVEVDLGRQTRAVERHLLPPFVRSDKTEATLLHDLLDSASHVLLLTHPMKEDCSRLVKRTEDASIIIGGPLTLALSREGRGNPFMNRKSI